MQAPNSAYFAVAVLADKAPPGVPSICVIVALTDPSKSTLVGRGQSLCALSANEVAAMEWQFYFRHAAQDDVPRINVVAHDASGKVSAAHHCFSRFRTAMHSRKKASCGCLFDSLFGSG